MSEVFYMAKSGNVRVPVWKCRQKKGRKRYVYFKWTDNSGPEPKPRTCSDPAQAKKIADELAEAIAAGETQMVSYTQIRRPLNNALEASRSTGMRIDKAVQLVADAVKIVPADEILTACAYWKEHKPGSFTPKLAAEAVTEFLTRQKGHVSERRHKTNTSYLTTFAREFSGRLLHEIKPVEIADKANAHGWAKKTRNDYLGEVGLLFKDAVVRGYTLENAASKDVVKRDKLRGSAVAVFTPEEGQALLKGVGAELKAFLATWCFSGLRAAEIARLYWEQVNQALESGALYLAAASAKTGVSRSVPICSNLRAWLMKYRQDDGPVVPEQWSSIQGLSEVARHISRASGVHWKANGPRHSYATYHLVLHKDPAATVKAMGTSLAKFERHYWSKAASITPETAQAWFNIMPENPASDLPLPVDQSASDVLSSLIHIRAESAGHFTGRGGQPHAKSAARGPRSVGGPDYMGGSIRSVEVSGRGGPSGSEQGRS